MLLSLQFTKHCSDSDIVHTTRDKISCDYHNPALPCLPHLYYISPLFPSFLPPTLCTPHHISHLHNSKAALPTILSDLALQKHAATCLLHLSLLAKQPIHHLTVVKMTSQTIRDKAERLCSMGQPQLIVASVPADFKANTMD